jgi:hypothetical protein
MRISPCGLLLAAGLVVASGSCRPAPEDVAIIGTEELPGPSWLIAARRGGQALLVSGDAAARGATRPRRGQPGHEPATQTLVYADGQVAAGPSAARAALALPHAQVADSVHFLRVTLAGAPVLFTRGGDSPLRESPSTPDVWLLERHDRLWLVTATRAEQLTADTVRGIARDSLARRVREEGPHLFWASAAVWSPDGSQVAYVTNRSWMLSPRGGQEIWLVNVRTREERPLLSEEGRSFYPDGWLGEDVVFRSDSPGFAAVSARDGQRRLLAAGSPVAFAPERLLYMTQEGERWRGHLLSANGLDQLPAPPSGEMLVHSGAFSPSGERLLLESALEADSGITRVLYLYDLRTRRLSPLLRWNHREQDRTPVGPPQWLDDSALLLTQRDRTSGVETSAIVRLGRRR